MIFWDEAIYPILIPANPHAFEKVLKIIRFSYSNIFLIKLYLPYSAYASSTIINPSKFSIIFKT